MYDCCWLPCSLHELSLSGRMHPCLCDIDVLEASSLGYGKDVAPKAFAGLAVGVPFAWPLWGPGPKGYSALRYARRALSRSPFLTKSSSSVLCPWEIVQSRQGTKYLVTTPILSPPISSRSPREDFDPTWEDFQRAKNFEVGGKIFLTFQPLRSMV